MLIDPSQIYEMYPRSKTSMYVTTADVPVETLLVDGPGRKVPPAPEEEFEGDDDESGVLLFLFKWCSPAYVA